MKKFYSGMAVCLLCFLLAMLCGCGEEQRAVCTVENEEVRAQAMEILAGAWECEDNPLGVPDCYVGYLHLKISSDGSFEMYDAEAGNPGIAGKLLFPEDGVVQLADVDRADFDPPSVWDSMEPDQTLTYQLKSETKLLLTYTDPENGEKLTLIFDKVKK